MTAVNADLGRRADRVRVALRAHIEQAGKQCVGGKMWYPVDLTGSVARQLRRAGIERPALDECLALLTEWGDYKPTDSDRGMVRYL